MNRLVRFIAERMARAALRKWIKEHGMKPLSKKWAWLGNIGAVAAVITSIAGYLPGPAAAIAAAVAALLNSVSHSLPGTGGTPQNP